MVQSYSAFNEMLNGKRSLSPELAMMMEAAPGVDAAPLRYAEAADKNGHGQSH